jgi:protein SCO1
MLTTRVLSIGIFLLSLVSNSLYSYDPEHGKKINKTPTELEGLELKAELGKKIPLDLLFFDEEGKEVVLKSLFQSGKPIVLSLVYYKCPTLCNLHLNGLNQVFKDLQWNLGNEYQFIAVSIDPSEDSTTSNPKKNAYWEDYKKSKPQLTTMGMHFLTDKSGNSKILAEAVGFPYRWNPGNNQWIHPAVAYVLTPEGSISRYFNGITFNESDLKLALVEAGGGKIGTIVDRLVLFCFQFDPTKNRYTLYAYNLMKIGGGVTVLFMGLYLFSFWKRKPE